MPNKISKKATKLKRKLYAFSRVPEELHRIPCSIFAHRSQNADRTISFMKTCVKDGRLSSNELPDIIVTLDNGIIFHSLYIEESIFKTWVKQQSDIHQGEKYIHLETSDEKTLGMFLLILLCVIPPEPIISAYIIKRYLEEGIHDIKFNVIEP